MRSPGLRFPPLLLSAVLAALAGCGPEEGDPLSGFPPEPPPDEVLLDLPEEGAPLIAPVTIAARGPELTSLTVEIDGTLVARVESAPWEFRLDPADFEPGEHEVVVTATAMEGSATRTLRLDFQPIPAPELRIERWQRHEIVLPDATWSGNAFDVPLRASFVHVASGRVVRPWGFYAGNDTWKLFFMPDEEGTWTWTTESPDTDLDGRQGVLECTPSDLPGRLVADGRRWLLSGSRRHDAPIMIPSDHWFRRTEGEDGVNAYIDWADETVGARVLATTLMFSTFDEASQIYLDGRFGVEFNLAVWDRLNDHYDRARDRGMGHYVMIYSDDNDNPSRNNIDPRSAEELRLLRYVLARLSCYPIVLWDTGIDIGEYRDDDWIRWFAEFMNANDPWRHPVGSRTGGGSGGIHPAAGTYWSDGTSIYPGHSTVVDTWRARAVPTAFTDRWREDGRRGGFDRELIRRVVWEVGLVGGTAVLVSGNNTASGPLGADYAEDFQAAPDCGHAARFFRDEVRDPGALEPRSDLATGADAVVAADIGHEYVVYLPAGGTTSLALGTDAGSYDARWYKVTDGTFEQAASGFPAGTRDWTAPGDGDRVLHIVRIEGS